MPVARLCPKPSVMTKSPASPNAAVIVAAGRGIRAGGEQPKQWCMLGGSAVADWTIRAFQNHPQIDHIVLVLNPEDIKDRSAYGQWDKVEVCIGGQTRDASVRAGLGALAGRGIANVLIHDVARPCIDAATITSVLQALQSSRGAAPALAVTDALWTGEDAKVTGTRDRAGLFRAQTPQGFDFDAISAAHAAHPGGALDDVEVARSAGIEVAIVPGSEANLKITYPADFARAEAILKGRNMDVRLGNGYDVHRFGPGAFVTLCGVDIAHERGLQGHSDADVGMHAVTDAIYGALAEGDIGQHFPPSDPQWKGAASRIFLEHAMSRARARGYNVSNIDCTLVCETPKIGPHAVEMRNKMAEIMQLDPACVSVKATTSERLGFTGRQEGIAAIATATLVAG